VGVSDFKGGQLSFLDLPSNKLDTYLLSVREDSLSYKIVRIFKEVNRPLSPLEIKKLYTESKMYKGESRKLVNRNIQSTLSYLKKKEIIGYDGKLYFLK